MYLSTQNAKNQFGLESLDCKIMRRTWCNILQTVDIDPHISKAQGSRTLIMRIVILIS
jgi:hypothetical protein